MNRTYWIVIGGLIAGLGIAAFGGWRLLVYPQTVDYAAAVAQKADLDQQLQTARDTAAQFPKFKAQAEALSRNLEFYNSRTNVPLNDVTATQMLTDLGNQMGLSKLAVSIKSSTPSGPGTLGMYDMNMDFTSDFEQLGKFMNACVRQRAIMVPNSLEMDAADDPFGVYGTTLTVNLVVLIYGQIGKAGGN
ncbi:MAG TPA: type 4a pilus biogenesis protein PilO [bacterium]|nr:type 4a pilus biogenesis protein PilO [bacterium]